MRIHAVTATQAIYGYRVVTRLVNRQMASERLLRVTPKRVS
ncbi:hypothetical protein ACLEPN_43070 [Myxococcus sp. 1LA]